MSQGISYTAAKIDDKSEKFFLTGSQIIKLLFFLVIKLIF